MKKHLKRLTLIIALTVFYSLIWRSLFDLCMSFLVVLHWPTFRVIEASIFLGVLVGTFLIPLVIRTYHYVRLWKFKHETKQQVKRKVVEKSK